MRIIILYCASSDTREWEAVLRKNIHVNKFLRLRQLLRAKLNDDSATKCMNTNLDAADATPSHRSYEVFRLEGNVVDGLHITSRLHNKTLWSVRIVAERCTAVVVDKHDKNDIEG